MITEREFNALRMVLMTIITFIFLVWMEVLVNEVHGDYLVGIGIMWGLTMFYLSLVGDC